MPNRSFVDSNIWVYSFTRDDDPRGTIAREFIGRASVNTELFISYQVINETVLVLKKHGYTEPELRQVINSMVLICDICAFTQDSVKLASELRETTSVSFWDSHIASNAIVSGCDMLVSEDFQDGAIIRGVRVKNIFM